jgi:chromosome segregation ATPase
MGNEAILISGIEHKIRKLIALNVKLNEENAKLHQQIDDLENNNQALTVEIENRKNELLNITLANTFETEFGVEESKTKIGNLIEEIDRCIEVLSE